MTDFENMSLTEALAGLGIRHEEHNGISRKLYRGEEYLGTFTATEGWAYVRGMSVNDYTDMMKRRPAEDLTPEGIQLVIPGAERVQPASVKQLDLF